MISVALKGLAARKLRSFLTAIAIVLGVAMVSGTFLLTDTIEKAFDSIFSSSYEQTDAVVSGRKVLDWSQSGKAVVPEELLRRIAALPQVEAAAGTLVDLSGDTDLVKLLDKQGEPIPTEPSFGLGVPAGEERFNPFELVDGEWASGGDQVVLDATTADKYGFSVGDLIRVAAEGPVQTFQVVGIARFGDVDTIGSASFAVFDVATAQALHHKDGFDAIAVAAKSGVTERELVDEIRPLLPSTTRVLTAEAQAAEDGEGVGEFVTLIRYFLLAFGGIALFVGAFVIFNTLSITVAQRTRELATLRTLGASRRQVLASVVLEGAAIGAVASIVGLLLGFALAKGLSSLFEAMDLALPQAGLVFAPRTVIVSIVLGVVVTVLASLWPAVRATRIAPIAAVREGAAAAQGRVSRKTTAAAAILTPLASASLAYGLLADGVEARTRLLTIALGALGVFLGVAMLAPRLVRPLAAVVGAPGARIGGVAGRLARENALRNPGRTAATAAALMIGLTLVTFVAVFGQGLLSSDERAVRDQLTTSYVVTSQNGWDSLTADAGRALGRAEGISLASSVRADRALMPDGSEVDVSAVDPATAGRALRWNWVEGSSEGMASLGRDGAILRKEAAEDHGLSVGERFALTTPAGEKVSLRVVGVYEPPRFDPLLGPVILSQRQFDATFPRPSDQFTFVNATSQEAVERALTAFPDAKVHTQAGFVEERGSEFAMILNLFYVLLALSVVVSLFGIVNTLVLAVYERTRELGMLRAVGMTRRQVRRMIRHESVVTALIGAGIGIPLGIAFGALAIRSLAEFGAGFALPVGQLAIFAGIAVLAGIVAAIMPARRASRLNVLEALQYE
jgi:putative ABC transport system permease protein